MVTLTTTSHIRPDDGFAPQARALLNEAYPEGAPHELESYYSTHGFPTTTILLSEKRKLVGHLAIFERLIKIGTEGLRVGLIGEVAVAADCRGQGLARGLVRHAHEYLQERSIPFSLLFAYEPRVYLSSGYKLMQNQMRFLDRDGQWKSLVYRGSMYAELSGRPWPNEPIDLCGRTI